MKRIDQAEAESPRARDPSHSRIVEDPNSDGFFREISSDDKLTRAFDLVVADASWWWTEQLFSPLSKLGQHLLLLKTCDWRNAWHQRRPAKDWFFPYRQIDPYLSEQTLILPPGWMKSYPKFGMRPIAWSIKRWRQSQSVRRPLVLAISYPHYMHLADLVRPDALVYYNMDDYSFYWSSRRESVRRLEQRAVREADLSVFCARARADELTALIPEAAERIVHLPHGAPEGSIAPAPQDRPAKPPADIAHLPRPILGFVGSLEDRLDWPLLESVAKAFPDGSIVLIGKEPTPPARVNWYEQYRRVAAMSNVHTLGWRTQSEIGSYCATFDVCLIPYRTDHPFNKASCPTKVMDYMATSRPVVTTPLPECRLYDHLFDVAEPGEDFIAAVRKLVAHNSDDGRARLRWEAARAHTWERTSEELLSLMREAAIGRF